MYERTIMDSELLAIQPHVMKMAELQIALNTTPKLLEKNGIQFHDGHRIISIPAEYSLVIAGAVAHALNEMIFEVEMSGPPLPLEEK